MTLLVKPFINAFSWYNVQLLKHPIKTSSVTAGILGALGDYINQMYIEQHRKKDKIINF